MLRRSVQSVHFNNPQALSAWHTILIMLLLFENLWTIQCFLLELPPEHRYSFLDIVVSFLSCGPNNLTLGFFKRMCPGN